MTDRRCVCPSFVSRRECIDVRYGGNAHDEECECVCHDADDEDEQEFYVDQLITAPADGGGRRVRK